jgi:hypothetical protein
VLTLEDLKAFEPHAIFAKGERLVNYGNSYHWQKWVAVRGGIWDWAIYAMDSRYDALVNWDWGRIKTNGDKIHSRTEIKELVSCDDESLAMYRG